MTTTSGKTSTGLKGGLLIGITFTTGLAIGVFAVIAIQNFSAQSERTAQDVAQRDVQRSSMKSADGASTTDSVEVGQFQEIFKLPSAFDQNILLHASLSVASEEDLKDWWIQSQKIARNSHRETVQDAILRKMVGVNPQEALRYAEAASKFQTDTLLMSVFKEWAVSQLDEAIETASAFLGPQRNIALQAILETRDDLSESKRRSIAMQLEGEETFLKYVSDTKALQNIAEPQESWEILLSDDVDDYLQTASLAIVAEAWREQIGFEVLSNIYHTEMEYFRAKLQLVSAVAQADLAGALDYTRGLPDENEKLYLSRVIAREWARTDAYAALTAISTFEPTSLASELEKTIANIWASTKPDELIQNISAISEESRLWPLGTAFTRIAGQNPAEAIAKLSSVENYVGNTSTIVQRIVLRWSNQEPAVAADWVVSNFAEDDPQRRKMLEDILPNFASKDPNQAFELAIAQPTPSTGFGLELYVIGAVSLDGDIELAKKLLPRVTKNTQAIAYGEVGRAMVRKSKTAEAIELGKDLSGRDQQRFYGRVLSTWASTSPKNLYESLENFPTSKLKSIAAMKLISSNQHQPVLTDAQIEQARTFLSSDDEATVKRLENR